MADCGATGAPVALVVGADQRSSTLALRDRLYVEEHQRLHLLAELHAEGVEQAMLVATCDRVEVVAAHDQPADAVARILAVLSRHAGLDAAEIADQIYVFTGESAVHHVFAVTASLESTVLGEPHVLGQIKDSHRSAQAAGSAGGALDALLQHAFAAAKRVRSETAIGRGPVSVAAAAVELSRGVHGDLDRAAGLLVGTGEMAELIVESLRDAGLGRLTVTDTRASRAESMARTHRCHVAPFDDLAAALVESDVVVAGLGSRTPVLQKPMLRSALKRRRQRPIVVFDAAVPGDVDPAADALEAVFLYAIEDLERVAREGREARASEIEAARRIIAEAVDAFQRDRAERAAAPVLVRLRRQFEAERARALVDAGGDAEAATRLLINRLLHRPSRRLRDIAARGEDARDELAGIERLLQRLFESGDEDATE